MPFITALTLTLIFSTVIFYNKFDVTDDIVHKEIEYLANTFEQVTDFINEWVDASNKGQIKKINFEKINNAGILFPNTEVNGTGDDTTIQLKGNDTIFQIIPDPDNKENACKVLFDVRDDTSLMNRPKLTESFFGTYYCETLYGGFTESDAVDLLNGDYVLSGTDSDGIFGCTYYYGSEPIEMKAYYIHAIGNVDYIRSFDSPQICETLTYFSNINTNRQNEIITFYQSSDGNCTGKDLEVSRDDLIAADINMDYNVTVVEPTKNKAPTLEDYVTYNVYYIFGVGDVDYIRSTEPLVCDTIFNGTDMVAYNQLEIITYYQSDDGSCSGKDLEVGASDLIATDANLDYNVSIVAPTKNKAPTLEDLPVFSDDEYTVFAVGDVDYIRSSDPLTCTTLTDSSNIVIDDQFEIITYFKSDDGSCSGKNLEVYYDDMVIADVNVNYELNIVAPTKNKPPTLEDR
ncbi:MAG: hypothetical protein U9Q33_11115 [Campylobacterota bacterium]|nr:hypothetical protein [Campylobacterota bacterium]